MKHLATILLLLVLAVPVIAQDTKQDDAMKNCPMHEQHTAQQAHHATVESHGDQAMGFPHDIFAWRRTVARLKSS
jgi:hypothetical protein